MSLANYIHNIMACFQKYAGKEGDKTKMNKREVKQMFKEQLGLGNLTCEEFDSFLTKLDSNSDQQVDFMEFVLLVDALCRVISTETLESTFLLQNIQNIKKVFETYAGKEGAKDKLNKHEVKDLLQNEFFKGQKICDDEVAKFLKSLDQDGDSEVNFSEFVSFVAMLCEMCSGDLA
ncbi:calmodulin-like protein 8 [Protopterus annectens]|uniref:calmodulin-like protein 8 n=1 Tax=Protopterus annectens TaxID=7888 RepID=UPI001CFB08FB|nr:calmodulin-like protein 8 [Protopterus annectens]